MIDNPFPPLGSIPIQEAPMMDGSKKAVLLDGVIHVSPAMWKLMGDSTSEELEHLLRNIELINLGDSFSFREGGLSLKQRD